MMVTALLTIVVVGLLTAGSAVLYLLPAIIGIARRVPDIGALAVINILLGWTLLGWVTALALALRSAPAAGPAVQVFHNFPPPPPPNQFAGAGWTGPLPRPGVPPPLVLPPRPASPTDPTGPE
jgi:Superinfection immunity protein